MKIIIIYNRNLDRVISKFGRQNQEVYDEQTIRQIESIFQDQGFEVQILDGNLDLFEKLRALTAEKEKIPFVFNLAFGIQGESRYSHIPGILEMLGLPYFGSGPFGHSLALDKVVTKILMEAHQIPTPRYWEFYSMNALNQHIDFPVIIKPSMDAGSAGLSMAHNQNELRGTVHQLLQEYTVVFAEQFIEGKEYALGLLGNGPSLEFLPLVEIDPENLTEDVYDQDQKKHKVKVSPANVPQALLDQLQHKARHLFSLLRLRDYGRIDIRVNSEGQFYFLEINSMAGLRNTGVYVAAARIAGYTYDEIILKLLDVAVNKYYVERQKLKVRYESKYKKGRK
ncbi:MAG: ATP-grasp domain-containing protein [Bacteroidales bacterium]